MMAPSIAAAAPTGVNLVVNPGFENVDLATTSYYNAPQILDWTGAVSGFAYSHDGSSSNAGVVPDYAEGGPLAGGGHWYFSPGNGGNHSFAEALQQSIDVSAGPSGAQIASGNAQYDLSAFFSTYDAQIDRGFVRADFLSASSAILGTAEVSSPGVPALATWTEFSATGSIPVGTTTVALSAWGEIGQPGSADGYTDNISFSVIPEPASVVLAGFGLAAAGLARRQRRDDSCA